MLGFAVPFTSSSKQGKIVGPKPLCWAKPTCSDFSSSNSQFAESHTEHWWSCSKEEVLSVLGPLGYTFEFDVNMGPCFSWGWHYEIATNGSLSEMHPLLVHNVGHQSSNARYSKANSSKKEYVKIVKKQRIRVFKNVVWSPKIRWMLLLLFECKHNLQHESLHCPIFL